MDAEVDHQWDKAVGSEDGIAGAEPVVVGHVDPAENRELAFVLRLGWKCSFEL